MKKIFGNISKTLLFSVFVMQSPVFAQIDSLAEEVVTADSARLFRRAVYFSDNPKQTALERIIDSTLESFMMSPQNCGISIGISQKGKNYFYNYGEIKRDSKIAPDSNSIYDIGSITKTFTALLLAKAVTENKCKLEDDIRKYLPGKFHNLTYYGKVIRAAIGNVIGRIGGAAGGPIVAVGRDAFVMATTSTRRDSLGNVEAIVDALHVNAVPLR